MVGLAGRVALLQRLGQVVADAADAAAGAGVVARMGSWPMLLLHEAVGGRLPAARILAAVLHRLGPIWPGRQTFARGQPGRHLGRTRAWAWCPLHKLSQWLTYSMLEPLQAAGIEVTDLDALTGLAEYRNGGLFLDGGLLRAKHPRRAAASVHPVDAAGDRRMARVDRGPDRSHRGRAAPAAWAWTPQSLPLAKVLEGGTWRAGRAIAAELRPDASPPVRVHSDGTVF